MSRTEHNSNVFIASPPRGLSGLPPLSLCSAGSDNLNLLQHHKKFHCHKWLPSNIASRTQYVTSRYPVGSKWQGDRSRLVPPHQHLKDPQHFLLCCQMLVRRASFGNIARISIGWLPSQKSTGKRCSSIFSGDVTISTRFGPVTPSRAVEGESLILHPHQSVLQVPLVVATR
jgi:hypothetical protein